MKKIADISFNVLMTAIGVSLIWGAIWYSGYSSLLTLQQTEVTGNHFISAETVQQTLADYIGTELTTDDILQIQQSLCEVDYIKAVKVSREFPAALKLAILENEPIAYLNCVNGQVAVDSEGTILPVDPAVKAFFDLPEVEGDTDQYAAAELKASGGTEFVQDILRMVNCIHTECDSIYNWVGVIRVRGDQIQLMNKARKTTIKLNRSDIQGDTAILNAFASSISDRRQLEDYEYIDFTVPKEIIVKEKRI